MNEFETRGKKEEQQEKSYILQTEEVAVAQRWKEAVAPAWQHTEGTCLCCMLSVSLPYKVIDLVGGYFRQEAGTNPVPNNPI